MTIKSSDLIALLVVVRDLQNTAAELGKLARTIEGGAWHLWDERRA